ncbi:cardiolipin synthase [bacterium]|nr:cardiolipin synthase [bacterium]
MLADAYNFILSNTKIALPYISFIFYLTLSILVSLHILLRRQENKTALAWLALVWLSPFFGSLLYMAFGINRVWRKTKLLKSPAIKKVIEQLYQTDIAQELNIPDNLESLANTHSRISSFPLSAGNQIKPLINGEQAYAPMLEAIKQAKHSVSMCSYIFDDDAIGKKFAQALIEASKRGVEVCLLIDAVGLRYSFPSILHRFKHSQVKAKRFLPTFVPWKMPYINLRNHRKTLIIDGEKGFTGGMNIRLGHCLEGRHKHKIQDVHFFVEGPIIKQMQVVFVMDWLYSSGETLTGKKWFPNLKDAGNSMMRSILDGPDEDINTLKMILISAISQAKKSISIVSPYFLPNVTLINVLKVAQQRGVKINIVVPEENNLKLVHWASQKILEEMVKMGCHVYSSKPPFDHSKLMLVDDAWAFIGSANWDSRSLRLNFEFNLEVYDQNFSQEIKKIIDQKIEQGRKLKRHDFLDINLLKQLKIGLARLFIPYL